MYYCTMRVPGALKGQKWALDPLELEFQMVGSHHMGAGKHPRSPGRRTSALNC